MGLVRTVVGLASISVLVAPALVGASANAGSAVVSAVTVPCLTGTAEPHGDFAHDDATATAAVKEQVDAEVKAQSAILRSRSARTGVAPLPERIRVPVQIHIIHGKRKGNHKDRKVTRPDARKLFRVLRGGFNGNQDPTMARTGIEFDLKAITISRNDNWFHARPGSKADKRMHRALHRGKRRTLNIYINGVQARGGSLLGIARFPWLVGPYPKLDGITINVASLPGGKARGYNLGDTVIHEAGHWFGLFHTFEGACESPGDYVNDTAPEAAPSFSCELGRDSCPTERPAEWMEGDPEPEPVLDPVRNFMDYSFDRCMNQFTAGQRTRAVTLFMRYRHGR